MRLSHKYIMIGAEIRGSRALVCSNIYCISIFIMQLKLSSSKLLLLNLKAQISWREDAQPECDNCKPVITSAGVLWFTCLRPQRGSDSIQTHTFPTTYLVQCIHWWPLWLPMTIQQITKPYIISIIISSMKSACIFHELPLVTIWVRHKGHVYSMNYLW